MSSTPTTTYRKDTTMNAYTIADLVSLITAPASPVLVEYMPVSGHPILGTCDRYQVWMKQGHDLIAECVTDGEVLIVQDGRYVAHDEYNLAKNDDADNLIDVMAERAE